ncbi:MAG: oligosaccharide flippase family protein [Chloroflexota bacterium]|nr:oligosaccharide flippase family protein [Chloroflexota bacterium]
MRFPLFSVGAGLLNSASSQVPYVLMAASFGIGAVGIYALAMRIMALPGALLEQPVHEVYTSSAADLRGEPERLGSITERLALSLLGLGLPVFIAVAIAGPELFAGIFGETWTLAGRYAQLLAPWFAVSLVATPLSAIVVVRERQGPMLAFTAVALLVRSLSVYVGGFLGSQTVAVALLAASGVIINLISTGWFLQAAHTTTLRVLRPSLRLALAMVPLSVLLAAAVASANAALTYLAVGVTIVGNYYIVVRRVPELRRVLAALAGRAA